MNEINPQNKDKIVEALLAQVTAAIDGQPTSNRYIFTREDGRQQSAIVVVAPPEFVERVEHMAHTLFGPPAGSERRMF